MVELLAALAAFKRLERCQPPASLLPQPPADAAACLGRCHRDAAAACWGVWGGGSRWNIKCGSCANANGTALRYIFLSMLLVVGKTAAENGRERDDVKFYFCGNFEHWNLMR